MYIVMIGHNEQRKTSDQALMANFNERQRRRLKKLFFSQLLIRALMYTNCLNGYGQQAWSSIYTVL